MGIPLCPKSVDNIEETPCGYPFMSKKRGQYRGNLSYNFKFESAVLTKISLLPVYNGLKHDTGRRDFCVQT